MVIAFRHKNVAEIFVTIIIPVVLTETPRWVDIDSVASGQVSQTLIWDVTVSCTTADSILESFFSRGRRCSRVGSI